ncbi:DUF1735 domain-containing protein (plasmid) [Pedobacter sp. BS3]|uniref:BT_3987 domain-containing protein n=1 Tax=Pedobacter sp. BS3 TaxID=2567937 RepID=UPI0011EE98E2|nr:DUF1735 domain-containing protein [Pedobacter sp. BS3]TZF86024.1 DUF1735 domain-containing protein [Pedobacter sp. BS3]
MKIKSLLYIALIMFAGLFLYTCKYNTDIANPGDYVKIYMPQATDAPAKRTFVMADTLQTIIYGAAYGGTDYPGNDIEVSFKVDNSLVQDFNTKNGTDYAVMPQGSYELQTTSATIKKGELKTAPLKIKIKTAGSLEAFKQYLLPVSIEQVSGNLPVNENLRTSYFLVEAQRDGISLKVMSYGKGSGYNDMNALAASINTVNPDLLLVREIDKGTTRNGNTDQPAILSKLIGMPYYAFANGLDYQGGKYGCVVYSKFPIVDSAAYQLPTTPAEKGPLAIITVQVNDTHKLVFAGTHLNANATYRSTQTPALLNIMSAYTDIPVILAGNFNDKPVTGDTYVQMATQFSFPCTTCPANYPASAPATNSDYIMFKPSASFRVLDYTVAGSSVSTHLPVIVQLQMFY